MNQTMFYAHHWFAFIRNNFETDHFKDNRKGGGFFGEYTFMAAAFILLLVLLLIIIPFIARPKSAIERAFNSALDNLGAITDWFK